MALDYTFVNESSPYINAKFLNDLIAVVNSIDEASSKKGSVSTSSTAGNYIITVDGYTSAPTLESGDLLSVLIIPNVTNGGNPSITWGTSTYPIYDISTGMVLLAGQIVSGVPTQLIFDGSKFWFNGSGSCRVKSVSITDTSYTLAVADNTEYRFTNAVTSLTITYPAGNFECWMMFTTGTSISVTFPAITKYAGKVVTFKAGKTYEVSIKDGVVVAMEVVSQ